MIISSYFESLPLHPPLKPLESLSSYLLRIAEANAMEHLQEISALMEIATPTLARLKDYPLLSFGKAMLRTNTPQKDILTATFYHIGKKFGRSTRPSPFARFLERSLGSHLRYCPLCLEEDLYYRLTWRFLTLPGCYAHHVRFLEHCSQCGASIPLFAFPLKVGMCPTCSRDLRSCSTTTLSEQEIQSVLLRTLDLEYLLSPRDNEGKEEIVKVAGQRFATLRREKQLFARDVAEYLQVPEDHIRGIERGSVATNQGAPFQTYLHYVDYLGFSLQDIFENPSALYIAPKTSSPEKPSRSYQQRQADHLQHERALFKQLQEAIQQLKASQKPITISAIRAIVGLSPQGLQHYPSVKALWEQIIYDSQEEKKNVHGNMKMRW